MFIFFILACLLEEGNRIFSAAFERSLVEQDVDIVQQHAVKGRHVELVLLALLATTFQSGCVCLHDDADQEMDGHRLISKTAEEANERMKKNFDSMKQADPTFEPTMLNYLRSACKSNQLKLRLYSDSIAL